MQRGRGGGGDEVKTGGGGGGVGNFLKRGSQQKFVRQKYGTELGVRGRAVCFCLLTV